jgi:RNA polymerase sigma-70 factor (ECF subfamily)
VTERRHRAHPPDVPADAARARSQGPPEPPDLEALYRRHASFVWRAVRRMGIPEESADDVVQEVFIVARRRLPTYEGRGAASSWLYGIARGVTANLRRHDERKRRRLELVALPSAPVGDPEADLQARRAADRVRAFLATLDPDQREVFVLADVEGLRGPEIAEALDVNLNTVYSRLRLARARFVRFVADREEVSA